MKLDLDGTHIISNRKFAKGFKQNGYEIVEILSEADVDKIENRLGNIIILSNFMDFKKDWNKIVEFGKKYDKLFYILWCWHFIADLPFKYWVFTFQEQKMEPVINKYLNEYNFFMNLENKKKFIPYRFSSYIDPLSNYKVLNNLDKIYDVLYIGAPYEIDKINLLKNNKNINSFIKISGGGPNAITGEEFENLYRQSKICLGFMADENNHKNTVTERIWEAFSFGCMVITNSEAAEICTNGTAVFYKDEHDFLDKINYFLKNDDKRNEKIEKGYKIFEDYGNYKYNAKEFIDYLEDKIEN